MLWHGVLALGERQNGREGRKEGRGWRERWREGGRKKKGILVREQSNVKGNSA